MQKCCCENRADSTFFAKFSQRFSFISIVCGYKRICEATGFMKIGFLEEFNRRKPLDDAAVPHTDLPMVFVPRILEQSSPPVGGRLKLTGSILVRLRSAQVLLFLTPSPQYRRDTARDCLRDVLEIGHTYESGVSERFVPVARCEFEFGLLQTGVRGHASFAEVPG